MTKQNFLNSIVIFVAITILLSCHSSNPKSSVGKSDTCRVESYSARNDFAHWCASCHSFNDGNKIENIPSYKELKNIDQDRIEALLKSGNHNGLFKEGLSITDCEMKNIVFALKADTLPNPNWRSFAAKLFASGERVPAIIN